MSRDERFTCMVHRDADGQVSQIDIRVEGSYGEVEQIHVNGSRATMLASALHDLVRAGGVTGRVWAGSRPFPLDQGTGAQVWLLLTAAKPLRRA
ncbi:MAG: hypothetical protein ACRDUY_09095, partial [Nitriliruptorales bacterium]